MKSKKSVEKLKNQQEEGEGQGKGQGLGDEKGRGKSLAKDVSEEEGEGVEIPYIYRSPNDDKFNDDSNDDLHRRLRKKLNASPDFDGPVKERRYTDVFCSFLIFIVWITTTGIGVYATINGDYRIVLYPMDYDGNICGTDIAKGGIPDGKESGNEEVSPKVDVSDYPKIVYVNNFGGGVCVKECPNLKKSNANMSLVDVHTWITYDGVWQDSTEGNKSWLDLNYVDVADYSAAARQFSCKSETNSSNITNCSTDVSTSYNGPAISKGKGYAWYAMDTVEVLGGTQCIVTADAMMQLEQLIPETALDNSIFDRGMQVWSQLFADLWTARVYILGFGLCISMLLGFIYTNLLRIKYLFGFFIWISIILTLSMVFITGWYAKKTSDEWSDENPKLYSDKAIQATKVFSYITLAIGVILFMLIVYLRRRIQLAVACVKQAAKAVSSMTLLVFLPVLQCIGFIFFLVPWIFFTVHLASMGKTDTVFSSDSSPVPVRMYEYSDHITGMGLFLVWSFLWTAAFIIAFGDLTTALSVSTWYFTRNKKTIGSGVVRDAMKTIMKYHIGTAAFGSCILTLVRVLRYIGLKCKQLVQKAAGCKCGNVLLCCCHCCSLCFQKFIEYLSKNAYVQTAIFGTSFCTSAKEAFSLILRNAARMSTIGFVSEMVAIIGKLFVSSLAAGLSYIYMDREIGHKVESLAGPCVLVLFISYFIGDMFMGVFDMGTATVLQCFIADEEMFGGGEGSYAEDDLRKWLDDYEEQEKTILEKRIEKGKQKALKKKMKRAATKGKKT